MEDEDQKLAAPAPQPVNENAIANAVLARLQPQIQQMAPQQRQQAYDAVSAAMNQLKSEGWNDESIRFAVTPARAVAHQMEGRLQQERQNFAGMLAGKAQVDKCLETIDNFFEKFEDDPLIAEADVSIRTKIEKRLRSDPEFMNAWNVGQVDRAAIKRHCKEATNAFLKAAGRTEAAKENAAPPLRTGGNVVGARNEKSGVTVTPESEDDLNEHQRAFFFAGESVAKTYLHKKPEEARKWAMERAVKVGAPAGPKAKRVANW